MGAYKTSGTSLVFVLTSHIECKKCANNSKNVKFSSHLTWRILQNHVVKMQYTIRICVGKLRLKQY